MAKRSVKKKARPTTPARLQARIKPLQQRLREDGLDGLIISNPHDIRYLTGFVGDDSWLWIPARGLSLTVISDMRFEDHIPAEAPHVRVQMRKRNAKQYETLADAAARLLSKRELGKIGVQPSRLNVLTRKQISKAIGARHISDYDDKLMLQRAVKDAREIKNIREAVRIQQHAFIEMREILKPGITELEVAGYLEYRMKCLGADDLGFSTIVAYDGHASHNHALPGRLKLKKNSSILVDWGAQYNGYVSDMTRVLNMGKPKKHIAEIYKIVEEALHAGIEAIAPGVTLKEVDDASRDVLKKYGYTLGHGLGHGIGLYVHEQPSISQDTKRVLEPGNVITIEPGIYLGDQGGVRLEDDILVTKTGAENLSSLPTALDWSIV